jgi:altronate hydrolase
MDNPTTVLRIHPADNVAVAPHALKAGQTAFEGIAAQTDVPAGHKLALRVIRKGEPILKYGYPIGIATRDIQAG